MGGTGPVAARAAQWVVRLTADSEEERALARAGYEEWKAGDPTHADAARRIEDFIVQVNALRGNEQVRKPARAALNAQAQAARPRRARNALAVLLVAVVMGIPAWLVLQGQPPGYLLADMRTSAGEWQTQVLADGSRVSLKGASAVNVHLSEGQRSLELVRGDVMVDVAPDPDRPFRVDTPDGGVRALGTRFVVTREDGSTVLTMLESRALAESAARRLDSKTGLPRQGSDGSLTVAAGQRVRIRADGVEAMEPVDPRSVELAWTGHQMVVHDRPLAEVLDELARHRRGLVRYDASQIKGIKVSAVLPLDDPDRALQLLATSLPALRIRTLTPYLVMVDTQVAP
ncbi:MAG: FecR domain-containing protein [Polaromonas sp.]|nr:FecR domain-containing protein [Polaromonas sp.]